MVAGQLFGLELGARLEAQLARGRVNRWLAAIAIRQIANPREPTGRPMGTAMIHLSQPLLLPGPRFALSEVARQTPFAKGTLGLWSADHFVIYYRAGRVPQPGSVILGRVTGDVSMFAPSASSTSADPQRELTLRLPCFATGSPHPTATNALAEP